MGTYTNPCLRSSDAAIFREECKRILFVCSPSRCRSGQALADSDRWPWLEAIADWIATRIAADMPAVVACSALKKAYRQRLLSRTGDRAEEVRDCKCV